MATVEDFERLGLLGDHTPPDRLELLQWLDEQGHSLDEMVDAAARQNLSALAGDRRIVPGARLTRSEGIELSGLHPEVFDTLTTAIGFVPIAGAPDGETGYTADEIDAFRMVGSMSAMFTRDEALALVRVIGSTLSRLGESLVSMFLADVESPHIAAGAGELGLAHKVYDAVGLLDHFTPQLDPILRRHVLQAVERTRRASIGIERLKYRFAVGFVDLVGFTELTEAMSTLELTRFVRDFEARAHDVAWRSGARVVKLIGDEVMFVATDADAACRTAAGLTAAFGEEHEAVVPRGGLAYGDVLTRGGDYYGTVVNLAARLGDQAVPAEVLVTEAVVAEATGCRFEPAGRRMVKGFAEPIVTWSLASTDTAAPSEAPGADDVS